jgi:hypothetical protein
MRNSYFNHIYNYLNEKIVNFLYFIKDQNYFKTFSFFLLMSFLFNFELIVKFSKGKNYRNIM